MATWWAGTLLCGSPAGLRISPLVRLRLLGSAKGAADPLKPILGQLAGLGEGGSGLLARTATAWVMPPSLLSIGEKPPFQSQKAGKLLHFGLNFENCILTYSPVGRLRSAPPSRPAASRRVKSHPNPTKG